MDRHRAPRSRRLNRCIGGLAVLVAFGCLTWSNAAHPDDGAVEDMTRDDAFEWSNRLAETWMVEQRSGLFTTAQREEYQWHARQISRRIVRLVGPEELADLTLAGVPTPPPQLARCGSEARIFLEAALHDAQDYSEYLTRERYKPGQIVQRIDLRRYALIEVAAMVNLRCGHLSRRHRDELRDWRRAIRLQVAETTSNDRIRFVMEREIDSYFDKAAPCGRHTRQFVIAALKEARDMTKETWARKPDPTSSLPRGPLPTPRPAHTLRVPCATCGHDPSGSMAAFSCVVGPRQAAAKSFVTAAAPPPQDEGSFQGRTIRHSPHPEGRPQGRVTKDLAAAWHTLGP